uniref:Cytochrome P450 n=1 Tax=Chaetoceros debilis TaxID=122233 RepID=A0A7S3PZF2_9STRA
MVFFVTSAAVLTTFTVMLLILKQIFWGLRRDRSSNFPVPPRYIIGKGVLPISGSTSLFRRTGSRIYNCFDTKWTQIHFHVPFLPSSWCKELGEVFSIFVWAHWRTIINGEERVGKIIDEGGLIPSWPYFRPPKDLLGQSCCICFLKDAEEKHRMTTVIKDILCQENIIRFASDFSVIADSHVEHFLCKTSSNVDICDGGILYRVKVALGLGLSRRRESQHLQSYTGNHLLKSYSLELVNGPLFGLHRYFKDNEMSQEPLPPSLNDLSDSNHPEVVGLKEMPRDENIDRPIGKLELSWLHSFQKGILSFKLQFWLLSEYGRAMHARHYIVDGVLKNVVSGERKKFTDKEGTCCHKGGGAKVSRGDLGLLDSVFSRGSCTDIMSDEAIAELILMVWLIMDKGSAWTTSALHLLQNDQAMLHSIRNEIQLLQDCFGENGIFSEGALSQMGLLDGLIFDAIKVSPPFFGGMWQTSNTVELKDDMVQVPKRSNVLLMSCSSRRDDISDVNLHNGKKPQRIGENYPNLNLYGFLPLNGEEVPLMVLQTKIFLISVIRNCDLKNVQQWKQAESPKKNCL